MYKRQIDTHRLCRNTVIADRHDRTACPGIDDIQYNKQGQKYQYNADRKGRRIAAESVGINITKYKLMAFTISASLARCV